jgi:hypothetical protein
VPFCYAKGVKGKAVKISREPVAVSGDERPYPLTLMLGRRTSRSIREPENLPGFIVVLLNVVVG